MLRIFRSVENYNKISSPYKLPHNSGLHATSTRKLVDLRTPFKQRLPDYRGCNLMFSSIYVDKVESHIFAWTPSTPYFTGFQDGYILHSCWTHNRNLSFYPRVERIVGPLCLHGRNFYPKDKNVFSFLEFYRVNV